MGIENGGSHRVVVPINMSRKSLETSKRRDNPPIDVQLDHNECMVEVVCFLRWCPPPRSGVKRADVGVLVNFDTHRSKYLFVG